MNAELAGATLAIAEQYRDRARELPPHIVHELEQVAGTDTLSTAMRSEARRLLIACRAAAQ